MMSFAGPIYVGQDVPFIVKVTAGGTVYPELTVTDPTGFLTKFDMSVWTDNTSSVVDARVYVVDYHTYLIGIHRFEIKLFNDAAKTIDVTETRLINTDNVGTFVAILNPIDELVIDHNADGSVGDYLTRILNYLLIFENIGSGECPVEIQVKNGMGVAFEVKDISGGEIFARDILDSNGRAIVYLNKGTYKLEFYPPCGKEIAEPYKIITVNCQDSGTPSC